MDYFRHLALGEVQRHRYLVSPQPAEVVTVDELPLQLRDLVAGEGRPLLAGYVIFCQYVMGNAEAEIQV